MLERFPVDQADFDGPVLITGAGGCIGSWATALLVRAGVPVVVYDLTDDQRRPRLLMTEDQLAKVTWVTGDIADTAAVAKRRGEPSACARSSTSPPSRCRSARPTRSPARAPTWSARSTSWKPPAPPA